jgi:tetratricopeptide (TPR) repeat protein
MQKSVSRSSASNVTQALQQALALHQQGRLAEAEKIYRRILEAAPSQFDALHLLGVLKLQTGNNAEAHRLIAAALKVDPRSGDALTNLGLALRAMNRTAEALASFERALALAPNHVEALNNRGLLLLTDGRAADALSCFDQVLRLAPRHLARINRANALAGLGRLEEAIAEYDRVLAMFPNHAGARFNRGNALHGSARYAEAVADFDRALALTPQHAEAWNNRGIALYALNRRAEALSCYVRAVAIRTDYPDAHYNEALSLLAMRDFARGLAKYEWRLRRTGAPPHRRDLRAPLWLGEYPLGARTILLHAEQGLGDTMQFVRYAPLLARAGAKVVLEVQPELVSLLAATEGVDRVLARGEHLPAVDVRCAIPSLPLATGTRLDTIPAEIPYLRASPERLARWRSRMEALAPPRVALAWAGNPLHVNDRNRSIALAQLAPLLDVPARFVSVQRETADGDAEILQSERRITHLGGELADFADTAAVIALADLVVCVDTSVAHLAGAMGKPVFILLPFAADWRWMLDRTDTPWYPTARLFRQPALGDWDSAIGRVRDELRAAIGADYILDEAAQFKVPPVGYS